MPYQCMACPIMTPCYRLLYVTGQFNPSSAFQLTAGEGQALERLRYYTWGRPQGPEAGPASTPPSLLYFTNMRMQVGMVGSCSTTAPLLHAAANFVCINVMTMA